MEVIKLKDCPYDWAADENQVEIMLTIGAWHGHFNPAEYAALKHKLDEGRLELHEKLRGGDIVAARLVEKTSAGEILIEEFGLLISPFWRRKTYNFYPLRRA